MPGVAGGQDPLRVAQVWAAAFAGLMVDAAFDTASRGHLPGIVRLTLLAALILASSGASASTAQALGIGLLGFAFFDGFVVNAYGQLSWTPRAGWVQLVAFISYALGARLLVRHRCPHRATAADV